MFTSLAKVPLLYCFWTSEDGTQTCSLESPLFRRNIFDARRNVPAQPSFASGEKCRMHAQTLVGESNKGDLTALTVFIERRNENQGT